MNRAIVLAALSGLASSATAQVVINEVWENPPGDGDVFDVSLEYIELYGAPGTDLTGWAVALMKGGADLNNDNFPEGFPEIDEAFHLDGLSIGPSGFLVIYNDTTGFSDIPFLLAPGVNSAGFEAQHIDPPGILVDTPGKLANDGSSSYVLVRHRPGHSVVAGLSSYDNAVYAFHKDIIPDVNFDGKIDFGNESPIPGLAAPDVLDPLQMIDDVAWSNRGGKEYVRSSQQEISDTPGFNPDAISRVNYFGANPGLGLRINGSGETVPTRMADEEWIYGEQGPGDGSFAYDTARSGAPTDPNGDGFQDIDITGFEMTPGAFNDSTSAGITQFRFVRGDFNFDGIADAADFALATGLLGATLDDTTPCTDDTGNPILIGGSPVDCYAFEGRDANALMALMNMDPSDALGGGNDPAVTQSDLDTWAAEFGTANCNAADIAEPLGTLDIDDVLAFLNAFAAGQPAADIAAPSGTLDIDDVLAFLNAFAAGCP